MIVIFSKSAFFAKLGKLSGVIIRLKNIDPACRTEEILVRTV